jgi:nicotinamide phosphoribosyltransferase
MKLTSDLVGDELESAIDFKLHDFGSRGVSSTESAGIGGAAHLINFKGSDNIPGVLYANKYYDSDMSAFSVPASEHSSITTWTKNGELDAYRNMIKQYGGKYPIFAVVSDSYDIFNAVENIWGKELKEEVINCGSTLVIRPDSGDPATVVAKIALLLETTFGYTTNDKGYKILNHVRILQGDGITTESIEDILAKLIGYNFSAENVLFGQGGALLQQLDRDTCKWAYKACAAKIDGEWVDVYKDPVTDTGKQSKRGKIQLFKDTEGYFVTDTIEVGTSYNLTPMLTTTFLNGKITKTYNLEQIRGQVKKTT